ncbi:putative transcription factor bHLH041 [Cornus florida]|uniref:putative transcription factor bHLH041 n=1 Tax=Cornus florida TaxID=4283 RepID=UPI00289F4C13|nr:putative transcription factor bHLH041 [Cornus florida]
MDSIFLLDEGGRASFLHHIMQSFGCTYICMRSYLPQPSNVLFLMGGFYHEGNNQPNSFDEYKHTIIPVENDRVPGLAFKNSFPYLELKDSDLQRLASVDAQLRFYQEAKIKTAIFMGCKLGEIELGFSNEPQGFQPNLKMEIMNWFPEDFLQQTPAAELPAFPVDQNRPSSSSSSLRSLSFESPECSPLLFNIPSTSYTNPEVIPLEGPPFVQPLRPSSTTSAMLLQPLIPSSSATPIPFQQAILTLSQIRNIQFPTIESENAAMTQAILTVLSSPSSSSSSHQPPQQNLPPNYQISQKASAFKHYRSALAPSTQLSARVRRKNLHKRAISFFRSLNSMRPQENVRASNPTSTQLHHMMSERRRREKLNESFQTLRSLLPPGSKKDKASVLTSTTEYMSSLKAQVAELTQRNQLLEAQLLAPRDANYNRGVVIRGSSSNQRLEVRITNVAESTSEARMVDLQVIVRGECSLLDLAVRILEFLKQVNNVSLMSVEAEAQIVESNPVNQATFRLRIENGEWDESAFQEAVRRVVGDLAQ